MSEWPGAKVSCHHRLSHFISLLLEGHDSLSAIAAVRTQGQKRSAVPGGPAYSQYRVSERTPAWLTTASRPNLPDMHMVGPCPKFFPVVVGQRRSVHRLYTRSSFSVASRLRPGSELRTSRASLAQRAVRRFPDGTVGPLGCTSAVSAFYGKLPKRCGSGPRACANEFLDHLDSSSRATPYFSRSRPSSIATSRSAFRFAPRQRTLKTCRNDAAMRLKATSNIRRLDDACLGECEQSEKMLVARDNVVSFSS